MSSTRSQYGTRFNTAPAAFNPQTDLPEGFLAFLLPLHRELTPRQQSLAGKRAAVLAAAHNGQKPGYLAASEATRTNWTIPLPDWCADQRNQMTGPADDAELVVKMLNSGAPGVMLDLEDSMANTWSNLRTGIDNILAALKGELTYLDAKRNRTTGINESNTVTLIRPRGLHLSQAGVLQDELMSASLFDVAMVAYQADTDRLRHPLSFYIPKSESAEEALWWRDLFRALEDLQKLPRGYIKCMALVESHPIAYQMEEFMYHLREHILGLNLGRWDYMASLIHFNLEDPQWVLPDRNTIPHDVPFFQNLRGSLAMARTNDLHSATSQFFVNLVDNGFLDHRTGNFGYAVFGRVVGGIDVIDKIAKVKTGRRQGHDDVPAESVLIKSARRTAAA